MSAVQTATVEYCNCTWLQILQGLKSVILKLVRILLELWTAKSVSTVHWFEAAVMWRYRQFADRVSLTASSDQTKTMSDVTY